MLGTLHAPTNEKQRIQSSIQLPWWLSGEESTSQWRRLEFYPWSRKIPHALERPSWGTTTEPKSPIACVPQAREAIAVKEKPTQQWRPSAAITKPYFLSPKAHSQNQAQKPVPGFYLLWSQWSSASFLPLRRKNYRRQPQRKQRARHSTGTGESWV